MTTTYSDDPGELLGFAPDAAPAPQGVVQAALEALLADLAGLRGALVASVDGRPIAAVLPHHDTGSTAAIVAASLGLGARLADLAGDGALREIVVRSGSGYVVIYAVGERGVLTVLTNASANLALLHLKARQLCEDLAPALQPHHQAHPQPRTTERTTRC